MSEMTTRETIDARGAFCPGPLMELIAKLKLVQVGDEIEVLSSDKGSANDIPEWVKKVHHEMVGITQKDGYWSIVVRKAK
jgi:tRNA 2-thiouridine synthesizing protein A